LVEDLRMLYASYDLQILKNKKNDSKLMTVDRRPDAVVIITADENTAKLHNM
jgi:hypothetical protein